jgi:iron complex outermembrane receptor protein
MGKTTLVSFIISATVVTNVWSQEISRDTTLQEVIIQAYTSGKPLNEVPASIGYLSSADLNRYSNTSILPAANSIPGVRMEERSPGSYRFSIRGSLLRSPFGVRNVKFYWNGLPLTDGGGNTYLNLIDFNSVGSMEVIKGPGGSLYGAGTGGVVLLKSPLVKQDELQFSTTIGSFGLQRYQLGGQINSEKLNVRVQYAHQQSDGYRQQTKMVKDAMNADVSVLLNSKSTLSGTLFFTDITYQTPGGLNLAQFKKDPTQARPAGGPNKGAVEQHAAVYNKTPFLGLSYETEWNQQWSTHIGVFGSFSDFQNPTIRNYEKRVERNGGLRTENHFRFGNQLKQKITLGAELQYFNSPIKVFDNNRGTIGNLQTNDELTSHSALVFGQTDLELPSNFFVTLGGSVNFLNYDFQRIDPSPITHKKTFSPVISPRIALLKKLSNAVSLFASASQGFSPPSLAEVRPSTNTFNNDLRAESGTNYEAGIRGKIVKEKIAFDVTFYDFSLQHTIVSRHQADGAEYFVNAGKTAQHGIEATVSYSAYRDYEGFLSGVKIWSSYSYNHYRFRNYQSDVVDFSGNALTGVPPVVIVSGLDVMIRNSFYVNITANYTDHIPLNDVNDSFANEYFLLGSRIGYKIKFDKHLLDVFGGVDNALDRTYSLGNDLNAVGSRFYNAAPGRNFYIGAKFNLAFR